MKKLLSFLIPVLVVAAGIAGVYHFVYSDSYLSIPSDEDMSGSKYTGTWIEAGSSKEGDNYSGFVLQLAENGRALIKSSGRVESLGNWTESDSGVEFAPLVEGANFQKKSFTSTDGFLINGDKVFVLASAELELDSESLNDAIEEIRGNIDILTSEDSWDVEQGTSTLKESWLEFWTCLKELIHQYI